MKRPFLLLSVAVALHGCAHPRCPPGEYKKGDTCYRLPDASDDGPLDEPETSEDDSGLDEPEDADGRRDAMAAEPSPPPPAERSRDAGSAVAPDSSEMRMDASSAVSPQATPEAGTRPPAADAGAPPLVADPPACTPKIWYRDCDADGYAQNAVVSVSACDAPAPTTGCRGWTARAPGPKDATDCDDGNAARRPGATFGLAPNAVGGDLNCDGKVDRQYEVIEPLDPFVNAGMILAGTAFCNEDKLLCGCYQASALLSGYRGLVNGVPKFADSSPYYSHRILTVPPPCAAIESDAMLVSYRPPSAGCADSSPIEAAVVRNLCR